MSRPATRRPLAASPRWRCTSAKWRKLQGKFLPLEILLLKAIQANSLAVLYPRIDAGKGCDFSICAVVEAAGANQAHFEAALVQKLSALHKKAPGFVAS